MDLNLVVLLGRLAAPPDIVTNDDVRVRLLVAVRSEWPAKRLDLIPVMWWNPAEDELSGLPEVGAQVWATGAVQRRYWEGPDGRRSRIEMIAEHVSFPTDDALAANVHRVSERLDMARTLAMFPIPEEVSHAVVLD